MTGDGASVDRLRREAELATRQLIESWEEINLLYSIGEILGRTVTLSDAAATILREICDTVSAGLGAIYVHDDARGVLHAVAALGAAGEVPPIAVDDDESLVARTFRERHPVIADDATPGAAREAGVRRGAMLAVPVLWTTPQGGVPLGVVTLSAPKARAQFNAGDQKLVAAIASQIGTAIQIDRLVKTSVAQERLAHEMQMAHDLQMRLLPAPSSLAPDAECAARVEPAEHVGGDFYQLFKLGQGRVGVLIGDVSSHGYQAALIMALTMSAMAIHAQAHADPGEALAALRASLADELRETEMYLSICYVVVDPAHGTLRYANAGHPHAFVVRRDGAAERLAATDAPLGLGSNAPAVAQVPWTRGADLLVLFTDGISDARDDAGRVLGEAKVLEVVRARRADAPSRVVDGVFALLEGHMGGGVPADDQAIVVLRS
ncbi:MAG: SpoIIE family protein phosphatase [Gemmatimonadetes bacterium]|nr:SpoIIE family protein phosphatase [Gemmatimonadota bacterium]MBI3567200.1 SpoIIE family protein phosphatase [Gemmatimonadota bacterium]